MHVTCTLSMPLLSLSFSPKRGEVKSLWSVRRLNGRSSLENSLGGFFHLEDMLLVKQNGYEVLTAGLPYAADEIERVMVEARRQ